MAWECFTIPRQVLTLLFSRRGRGTTVNDLNPLRAQATRVVFSESVKSIRAVAEQVGLPQRLSNEEKARRWRAFCERTDSGN